LPLPGGVMPAGSLPMVLPPVLCFAIMALRGAPCEGTAAKPETSDADD